MNKPVYHTVLFSRMARYVRHWHSFTILLFLPFTAWAAAPTVSTEPVTLIGHNTATLNLQLTADGGEAITALGFLLYEFDGSDQTLPAGAGVTDRPVAFAALGSYADAVAALTPGTHYSVRAYATNADGTSYGTRVDFYTLSAPPSAHAAIFTATALSPTSIRLTFSPANTLTNAQGYVLLRRQGSAPDLGGIQNAVLPAGWTLAAGTSVVTTITDLAADTYDDTGLTATTAYHYALVPFNRSGVIAATSNYLNNASVPLANATTLTPAAPTVITTGVSAIGTATATAGGNITAVGVPDPTTRGAIVYVQDATNKIIGDPGVVNFPETPGPFGTGAFTAALTGLTPGTHYSTRAYATNTTGTGYGARVDFYTFSLTPSGHAATFTATTTGITAIALSFSAPNTLTNARGYVILRRQGAVPDLSGIQDGVLPAGWTLTGGTTVIQETTIPSASSFNDTGLTASTTYFYALVPYNRNAAGDAATSVYRTAATVPTASATTQDATPPTVVTGAVSSMAVTTATVAGEITAIGNPAPTERGVIFYLHDGTDKVEGDAGVTKSSTVAASYSTGVFTRNLTGLLAGTRYSTRAFAVNTSGAGYGARADFWTLSAEPTGHVTGLAATDRTSNSITLGWTAAPGATGYIVLLRADAAFPNATGVTDGQAPAALTFPTGTQLVANVTGTSALITGLAPITTYRFAVIPYAENTDPATFNYRTAATIPTLAAATLDESPPVFTGSTPSVATVANTNFSVSLQLDEPGRVFYVVLPLGGPSPSVSQLVAGQDGFGRTAAPDVLASGVVLVPTALTTVATPVITGLTAATNYDVYLVARDDAATPNFQAVPFLFRVRTAGVRVTPPAPLTLCVDPAAAFTPLGPIVIEESAPGDFSTGAGQTIILTIPPAFELEAPNTVTATKLRGDDLDPVINVTNTANQITFTLSVTGAAGAITDAFRIDNLRLRAVSAVAVPPACILRTGGTLTMNGNQPANNVTHATLNTTPPPATLVIGGGPPQNYVCPGSGPQLFFVGATPGSTYAWSVTGAGNTITPAAANTATVSIQFGNITGGVFTVSVTETTAAGCVGVTSTRDIYVPAPVTLTSSIPTSIGESDPPYNISALVTPPGGTFFGIGVAQNGADYFLVPSLINANTPVDITYRYTQSYTMPFGPPLTFACTYELVTTVTKESFTATIVGITNGQVFCSNGASVAGVRRAAGGAVLPGFTPDELAILDIGAGQLVSSPFYTGPASAANALVQTNGTDFGTYTFNPSQLPPGNYALLVRTFPGRTGGLLRIYEQLVFSVVAAPVVSYDNDGNAATAIPLAFCAGDAPITFTGTPSGGVFSITSSPVNTTAGFTAGTGTATFNPSVATFASAGGNVTTPTTHTIRYTFNDGTCTNFIERTFTINPLPVAPVLAPGTQLSYCSGTSSLSAQVTGQAGNTFQWAESADFLTPLSAGVTVAAGAGNSTLVNLNAITSIDATTPRVLTYWVRQISPEGCAGAALQVTFTINPSTPEPVLQPATVLEYCNGETLEDLQVIGLTGATWEWSIVNPADFSVQPPVGTTVTNAGSTSTLSHPIVLSAPGSTPVTLRYYVRQILNGCISNPLELLITINPTATLPILSNPIPEYCAGNQLEPITVTGIAGATWEWSEREDFSGSIVSGATIGAQNTFSNPILLTANGAPATLRYWVRQRVSGCVSPALLVQVLVNPRPAAPSAVSPAPICAGAPVPQLTAVGQNIKWYDQNPAGNPGLLPIRSGNTFPNSVSSEVTTQTTTTFFVTQTINDCESPATTVSVTVNPRPLAPIATTSVQVCAFQPVPTLTANGSNLIWFRDEALADSVGGGASFRPSVATNVTTETAYTFFVVQRVGACLSPATRVTLTVRPLPLVRIGGLNAARAYCLDASVVELSGFPGPETGLGIFSGPGVVLSGGRSTFSPGQAGVGTHSLRYTYTNLNGCTAADSLEVTVLPLPQVAFSGFNQLREYCIGGADVPLTGSPAGTTGVFSGNGIRSGTNLFSPNLAGEGTHTITYTFTDAGGCARAVSQTVTVLPLPAAPAFGAEEVAYCSGETIRPLSATGQGIRWYSARQELLAEGVSFLPVVLNTISGRDTVYTFLVTQTVRNCESVPVPVRIRINPLPVVSFIGVIPERAYCSDSPNISLTGFPTGGSFNSPTGAAVSAIGPGRAQVNVVASPPGRHRIVYTYTDPATRCTNSFEEEIDIFPVPVANFTEVVRCNDRLVNFTNTSLFAPETPIVSWEWNFGDGGTAQGPTPSHRFSGEGNYRVTLQVTTALGCTSTLSKVIRVGTLPEADFIWRRICQGEPTIFQDRTDIRQDQIEEWVWDFGDGNTGTGRNVTHRYERAGRYEVTLLVTSDQLCTDVVRKTVHILPSIAFGESVSSYAEGFENGTGGWFTEGANNSWALGQPAGQNIRRAATGAAAWMTGLATPYNISEQSFVNSPCFDLSALERPMLSLDVWADSETNRDGAAIQFSTDGGQTWQVLGTRGAPLNWYNSANIIGNPGNQNLLEGLVGWSGQMAGWTNARFPLDQLRQAAQVRFRMAFGADAVAIVGDGVAFDNFRILNRRKQTLVESFTNSATEADAIFMPRLYQLVQDFSRDAIGLNYHIALPNLTDSLNLDNPFATSARALFYDVATSPRTVIDGNAFSGRPVDLSFDPQSANYGREIMARSLQDPGFEVALNFPAQPGTNPLLEVNVRANIETADELVVHLATIERVIVARRGLNGQTRFEWVMKSMTPTAAGTSFRGKTWRPGDRELLTVPWVGARYYDARQVGVIAFIQNNRTKEIYQTVFRSPQEIPEIPVGLERLVPKELQAVRLYPNPASDMAWVWFEKGLTTDTNWQLLSVTGARVGEGRVKRNEEALSIQLSHLPNGLYHLKIWQPGTEGGFIVKKLVVMR